MKLYVVRHGETTYNLQNLCNSDPAVDVSLTERGKQQAENAAEKLKDKQLQHILISPLRRTLQTAAIINKYHNVPLVTDERILDRKTGFEGKNCEEFFAALNNSKDVWNVKFNDGESFEEEKKRVHAFLEDVRQLKKEGILVVCHSEIAKIITGYFHNLSNEEMWNLEIDNCQIVEFDTVMPWPQTDSLHQA